VKKAVSLPVLRKDFMIDPYQIYESRALGADCILLIMAALDDRLAAELYALSAELGMDVLVEVHDAQELERALALKPAMIGINNRNLKTLAVDVGVSHTLVKQIPAGILKISESGIAERETLLALKAAGFEGFLIGESLMKQQDIAAALASLL
jgi:indole-3-glycerol phosphate synthase